MSYILFGRRSDKKNNSFSYHLKWQQESLLYLHMRQILVSYMEVHVAQQFLPWKMNSASHFQILGKSVFVSLCVNGQEKDMNP